jgi:hypothetical protein
MREQSIQKRILLHCGHGNTRLYRANVGQAWQGTVIKQPSGDILIRNPYPIRFGAKGMSDLIGWHTVTITPEMVGRQLAVYSAIEVKTSRGRPSKDQLNFIENVRNSGGFAGIARSAEEAEQILKEIEG